MTPCNKEVNKTQLSMYKFKIKLMVISGEKPRDELFVDLLWAPTNTYEIEA